MSDYDEIEDRMREVSRDLNEFRERRLADRRFKARDTADRRVTSSSVPPAVDGVQQALLGKQTH
jgi:hypothetical protein